MRGRSAVAFALAFTVVLGASGCGSGSDSRSTAAQPSLTRKQYVRRANTICTNLSHELVRRSEVFRRQHGLDFREPDQHEREQLILAVLLPNVEEKLKALKALPPPRGDEPKLEAIFGSMEHGIATAKRHPAWSAAPSPRHPEPFADTIELTADFGIWLCGQAGG